MSPSAAFEIAELADLTIDQLVAKFEVVHQEKCRSRNRNFIVRRIAWRIQANEEGGLSERALLRAGPIADESVIRVTPPKPKVGGDVVRTKMPPNWDPRIPPPGSFVERRYKGKIRRVLILTDGFEYEDERFDSLSAVAKSITGNHLSGFRFFKLGEHA
ncbi:DUF2924 domain-containing protein [Rubripirellula reticaptiva]|uniref:DUF2924 domain-containing protein n=1 Tax=Rubripirellula reticaptiva TaxID=2528013 RepID=A0A5C6ED66_9BACT|nr:DUF2924 domain-containing protein [Rubripirellula reticaptiva]TWU46425.1 hypothetical protein Poly59_53680 [Rubripirellula reticaptiva]